MERACTPNESCPYYSTGCFEDTHHVFYPSGDYITPVERLFRNIPENKVEICRREHEDVHATEQPPLKPSYDVMEHAVIASGVFISRRARKAMRHAA